MAPRHKLKNVFKIQDYELVHKNLQFGVWSIFVQHCKIFRKLSKRNQLLSSHCFGPQMGHFKDNYYLNDQKSYKKSS